MTAYPPSLVLRLARELAEMRSAIKRLQSRTAGIDSGAPLAALPAKIVPAYSSGDPKALINGSTVLTGPYSTSRRTPRPPGTACWSSHPGRRYGRDLVRGTQLT